MPITTVNMLAEKFFDEHKIKYVPVDLKPINNKNMVFIGNKTFTYTTFPTMDIETCKHTYINPKYKDYKFMASDTYEIQRIDIDNVELFEKYCPPDILKKLKAGPHYLSRNKRLPHYIVKVKGLKKCNTQVKAFEKTEDNKNHVICDILNGQYAWLRRDEKVINATNEIVELTYDDLLPLIDCYKIKANEEKIKQKEQQKELKNQQKEQQKELKIQQKEQEKEKKNKEKKMLSDIKITKEDECKYLLSCLNSHRCDTYDDWITIGMILNNIFDGNETGFKLFDEFSKKYDKYDSNEVLSKWKSFKTGKDCYTIKKLYEYAIEDNYNDNYSHFSIYKDLINIQISDDDIGVYFHNLYKNILVCSKLGSQCIWHHYIKSVGLWTTETSHEYVIGLLKTCKSKVSSLISSSKKLLSNDNYDREIIEKLRNRAIDFYTCFKNKRAVYDAYKLTYELFYDKDFESKLNSKRELISFGEYVYDLNNLIWRKTEASDYISVKSGFTKDEILEADTKLAKKILKDIFSIPEQYEYTMKVFSNCLFGANRAEKFYVFSGTGANGKTLVDSYLKKAFGEYYATLPIEYLIKPRGQADQASPTLANLRYARITVSSEPPEGAKIQNSIIKLLTGGDTVQARRLYGNPFEFVPQFTPFILCNLSFYLQDSSDDAMDRRCVFNKFCNKYVNKPKLKHEKKIDLSLKDPKKIEEISKGLMSILIKTWEERYKDDKNNHYIKEPKILKKWKQEFMESSDVVHQFFEEKIEIVEDNDKNDIPFLQFIDLYKAYRQYCKDNGETITVNKNILLPRFVKESPRFEPRYIPKTEKGTKRKEYKNSFLHIKFRDDVDQYQFNNLDN